MKNDFLKVLAIALLCVAFTTASSGQTLTKKHNEKATKKHSKIDKSKVPKVVTEAFIAEYPSVVYEDYYGYPKHDFYDEWYGYNPYLFEYESPEYYVVEFTKNKTMHKAIYSKEGKKIAVHKKVTDGLPKSIANAIKKGTYNAWTVATEKEEIFKDTDKDKLKVYKVEVSSGTKKHHLFYDLEGVLLKDEKVK